MTKEKSATLADRCLTSLKNHRIVAALIIIAILVAGLESFTDSVSKLYTKTRVTAEDFGWVTSKEIKCWNKNLRPTDSHIAGMRVVERSTTLDLSAWNAASVNDLAKKQPVELAVSRNSFLIERTDGDQTCFIHRIGTSSGIEPTVHCNRCRKVALTQKEGSSLREWDIVFDVQDQQIGAAIPIVFSIDFWNGFQRPDQWWGGFRILHSTEKSIYTIIFPENKKPKEGGVQYQFVRSVSQNPESLAINPSDLKVRSGEGLVERVTWTVPNPQPDRSYRVYWIW